MAIGGIVHAVLVVGVIGDGTLGSFCCLAVMDVSLTGSDDFLDLSIPEPILNLLQPLMAFSFLGEDRLGNGAEILAGMIPVDDLDSVWEIMGNQVPNPDGPITDKNQFLGLVCQASNAGSPQQTTELLGGCDLSVITDFLSPGISLSVNRSHSIPTQGFQLSPFFSDRHLDAIQRTVQSFGDAF